MKIKKKIEDKLFIVRIPRISAAMRRVLNPIERRDGKRSFSLMDENIRRLPESIFENNVKDVRKMYVKTTLSNRKKKARNRVPINTPTAKRTLSENNEFILRFSFSGR